MDEGERQARAVGVDACGQVPQHVRGAWVADTVGDVEGGIVQLRLQRIQRAQPDHLPWGNGTDPLPGVRWAGRWRGERMLEAGPAG